MKRYLAMLLLLVFSLTGCNRSPQEQEQQTSAGEATPSSPLKPAVIADMALVPAGEFSMGAADTEALPDEQPVHRVFLPAYYIDKREVSNVQYQRFVLATKHPAPFVDRPWAEPYNWHGTAYPEGKGNYPVVLVSWEDAQAYARWISKRLPTEAEWERAARAGLSGKKYPHGDTLEMNHANFDKGFLRENGLQPVGSFEPSSAGLYDMAGNVWEWCQDWYDSEYYKNSSALNPQGPSEGSYRICRGGSWVNDKNFLRCSQRGKSTPDSRSHITGFRCARSAESAKSIP